jgi:hypothetical protein
MTSEKKLMTHDGLKDAEKLTEPLAYRRIIDGKICAKIPI